MQVRILLIEDNPADAALIEELLTDARADAMMSAFEPGRFELLAVPTLGAALEAIASSGPDIALLDLSLPDALGLEGLRRLQSANSGLPVIVLTSRNDDQAAVEALQQGAQDYLVKGKVDHAVLVRSLRYAVERSMLQRSLQRSQRDEEVAGFDRMTIQAHTPVATRLYGVPPLREGQPGLFAELVRRYTELLDQSLAQRNYRVDFNIADSLRAIAEELGFLRAGPRDLIEIYTTALKELIARASPQKAQHYVEEGRMMLIEMLGYLASHYRQLTLAIPPEPLPGRRRRLDQEVEHG